MNKLLLLLVVICNTLFASERILDFNANIQILDNGDILVVETIKINVENRRIRHGIYRDSPTVYFGTFLSQQKFDIVIINVELDNQEVGYTTERLLNGIRIKIGSKDYNVNKGIHNYTIEYIAYQQVKSFENSEGLYWNVTGTGWIFPIEKASADIYLPDNSRLKVLSMEAWTGKQGSTQQHFISRIGNNSFHFETTRGLNKYESLTIQSTWDKGAISNPESRTWFFIKNNIFWFASIFILLLYPWYFYNAWKKVGMDPPKKPIYPIFNPPTNISPAAMKFVREKHFDSKNFSITIMSLAAKSYISIEQKTKKNYILTKLDGQKTKDLSKGEEAVFNYLFNKLKTLTISDEYNYKIEEAIDLLEEILINEHHNAFYKNNAKEWLYGVVISLVVLLLTWIHFFNFSSFALAYLFIPAGMILFSAAVLHFAKVNHPTILFLIVITRTFLRPVLYIAAILSYAKKPYQKLLVAIVPAAIIIFIILAEHSTVTIAYLVVVVFIILLNTLFFKLIQAPTVFGQNLLGKIEGFRMYLNTAEQDRLDLMHPPEMTPKLFEKYLPYALALDVENRWSEQFNNAMQSQGKDMSNYHPNWYIGNNYSRFDFATTASTIGAGLVSSAVAAATPPASSGGVGGFGGGGFSGGGGGGGGGGGW